MTVDTTGRCPICGAMHTVCGAAPDVSPVDIPAARGASTVGELKEYQVRVGGMVTTLRLNERDAKRLEHDIVSDDSRARRTSKSDDAGTKQHHHVLNKERTAQTSTTHHGAKTHKDED